MESARRDALISSLSQLQSVLANVASQPGLLGESGNAAGESFEQASGNVEKQIEDLKGDMKDALRDTNSRRGKAERLLGTLGSGQLSPGQEAVPRMRASDQALSARAANGAASVVDGTNTAYSKGDSGP